MFFLVVVGLGSLIVFAIVVWISDVEGFVFDVGFIFYVVGNLGLY